uniref:Follistatin n=1 Tax=Calidris pygmaea TaxID=425635 RepID=A0A8C3JJM6_9CHAR
MLNQRIHPGMLLLLMFLCHFMEDHTVQGKTGLFIRRYVSLLLLLFSVFRGRVYGASFLPSETCENVDCGPGKKCKMNKKNKPRCVCAPDCSNITWKGPVCGLDGKTYRNECALLKARCKEQPELEVQYQGKCKKTCRDVLCPGSSTCVVDQTNNAYCVTCNRICPEPTSPEQYLCGNDGITYASACHLRKATCLLGRSIGLAYEGKCIKAKSCEDIQCSAGKKCLWDFKVGRGRCALCDELCPESKSDEAVCASDNTTYPSECAMKEAACSMGVLLEVKHSGSCNSINEDPEDEEEDEDQDYSFPISSILEW